MGCLHTFVCGKNAKNEQGATIVELSLVLPIFFLIILIIFEYTFYLTTQSLIQFAAQKAATMLAVAPDLDKACTDCSYPSTSSCTDEQNACSNRRVREISNAKRAALEFLYSTSFFTNDVAQQSSTRAYLDPGADFAVDPATFGENPDVMENRPSGIDIQLPISPRDGDNLKAAYASVPIRVVITAQRDSFLSGWFSFTPRTFRSVAQTWKEISISQSNPPALNCAGEPITNPNDPNNNRNCRCAAHPDDPNQVANNPGSAACSCLGNLVKNAEGICACPQYAVNQTPDENGNCGGCQTDLLTGSICNDRQRIGAVCQCDSCEQGNHRDPLNPGNCVICPIGSCNSDERVGTDSNNFCTCIPCTEPNTEPGSGNDANKCVCTTLDAAAAGCGPGGVVDPGTCRCHDCVSEGKVPSGGRCICPGPSTCTGLYVRDNTTCGCVCRNGSTGGVCNPDPIPGGTGGVYE